jgi:FkbM family methyltransferase
MPFLTSWRMKHRQQFFAPLIANGSLVFDVGANYGEYTAAFLSLGARRVIAIEPQGDLACFILTAFQDEVAHGKVIVRNEAVGATKGVAKLYSAPDPYKSMATLSTTFIEVARRSGREWDDTAADAVNIITLDSLIKEYGTPDYIKVDVEGFDLEVLNGLSSEISLISFEFNTQEGLIEIAAECITQIASLGNYIFNYHCEALAKHRCNLTGGLALV